MLPLRQALHIFRKDVVLLRYEIAVSLLILATFTFNALGSTGLQAVSLTVAEAATELLNFLLPLSWASLIARTIFLEPVPGDRQFWVTRPYAPYSLPIAKALFVAAFILLPKLVADATIIVGYGFDLPEKIAGLLWSQFLLATVFVLPLAALCTLTAGIVQLIAVLSTAALGAVVISLILPATGTDTWWFGLEWVRSYAGGSAAALGSLAIILIQYRRRHSHTGRNLVLPTVAFGLLPLVFLPWSTAFAVQSFVSSGASDVRVEGDNERKVQAREYNGSFELRVPVQFAGVPSGTKLQVEGADVAIESASGVLLRQDSFPPSQVAIDHPLVSVRMKAGGDLYRTFQGQPVRVRGRIYATLFGDLRRTVVPLEDGTRLHATPGLGLCSLVRTPRGCLLSCRSAYESRASIAEIDVIGASMMMSFLKLSGSRAAPVSYTPFPADLRMIPVTLTTRHTEVSGDYTGVMVTSMVPVAHFRRDFSIENVRF